MKPRMPAAMAGSTTPRPSAKVPPVPLTATNTVKRSSSDPDKIVVDVKQEFQPIEMLMDAPITVEFGVKLSESRTIHEGMLLKCSKKLQGVYNKAQQYRKSYAKCKKLSEEVESLIMKEMTVEDVQKGETEQEIIELITTTCKEYPFATSRDQLSKEISIAVNEQIEHKYAKSKRKETRGTTLQARLASLDPEGLLAILDSLSAKLHKFKAKEKESAKKDPIKAAAQRRLILHKEEEGTVQALMVWIYQGRLEYKNADQLYAIFRLADDLGIETLAETCLTRLCDDTSRSLQQARSQNLPLQYLLGYGISAECNETLPSVAIDNVVAIVFKHITKEENTPKRLLRIFVEALAGSLDMELWTLLKEVLSRDKMAALIEALLVRQVKTEQAAQTKSQIV